MDDSRTLLAEYVKNGSDAAFRQLVERYINLVHSTALRLVHGDTQLAEDVTQTVFMDLSRKARSLSPNVLLGGWLHRDTCFVAGTMMRGERRRQYRERQAVAMNVPEDHTEANLALVGPVLDEAIDLLEPDDRTAILLRFFEQLEFRAVGEMMGSSEDAARMRVSRALDKLQGLLKNRGVVLSAAGIGTLLAAGAVSAAPIGLAATVAGTILSSTATGGFTSTFLKIMSMTKFKIAAVGAIAVAAVAVPVALHQGSVGKLREENRSLRQQAAQLAALQAENERLSNMVFQAASNPPLAQRQMRELSQLRDEVGRLRQQSNDLTTARAELRANPSDLSVLAGVGFTNGKRTFRGITMAEFAQFIGTVLQAPVADQTGLTGTYDIEMTPPRTGPAGKMVERVTGILQNELGLELAPFSGPFTAQEDQFTNGHAASINIGLLPNGNYTATIANDPPPSRSPNAAGYAIRLEHPGAPGLTPHVGGQAWGMPVRSSFGQPQSFVDATNVPPAVAGKLRILDAAKRQWALESRKARSDTPTWLDLEAYLGDLNAFTNAVEGQYFIGPLGSSPTFQSNGKAPGFAAASIETKSQLSADACIINLRRIDAAKGQWALEYHKQNSDTPTIQDIQMYLGNGTNSELPGCPDGGNYIIEAVGIKPTCSIPGHVLP